MVTLVGGRRKFQSRVLPFGPKEAGQVLRSASKCSVKRRAQYQLHTVAHSTVANPSSYSGQLIRGQFRAKTRPSPVQSSYPAERKFDDKGSSVSFLTTILFPLHRLYSPHHPPIPPRLLRHRTRVYPTLAFRLSARASNSQRG